MLYVTYYPYCHFLALYKTYGTLRKNQEEQVLSCAKVRTRYTMGANSMLIRNFLGSDCASRV